MIPHQMLGASDSKRLVKNAVGEAANSVAIGLLNSPLFRRTSIVKIRRGFRTVSKTPAPFSIRFNKSAAHAPYAIDIEGA